MSFFLVSIIMTNAIVLAEPLQTRLEFKTNDEGSVEFITEANPGAISIVGKSKPPVGTLTVRKGRISGMLAVDLTELKTDDALQTKTMREKALEVDKFPQAQLDFTDAKMLIGAESVPFEANLNLHGVTKPVKGKIKFTRKTDSIEVHADFELKLKDYEIKAPKFSGAGVEDLVKVSINTDAELSRK